MRFKAKHDYLGQVADAVCKYTNISKSLAKKHHIMQVYRLHVLSSQCQDSVQIGLRKETEIIGLSDNCIQVIMERIPQVSLCYCSL